MRLHSGPCRNAPCERSHAYKCRFCGGWFSQAPYETPNTRTGFTASPFYPYCSVVCTVQAEQADKGFHLFANWVKMGINDPVALADYPDSSAHSEIQAVMQVRQD